MEWMGANNIRGRSFKETIDAIEGCQTPKLNFKTTEKIRYASNYMVWNRRSITTKTRWKVSEYKFL